MKHGVRHTYEDNGCRCPECTAAKIERNRRRYVPSKHRLNGGWPRTGEDVDEIAVERACLGDETIRLNRSEMLAAFAWMDAHRYTARTIAERLGITMRTVQRWRSQGRECAVSPRHGKAA